jgi:hypothetical protein
MYSYDIVLNFTPVKYKIEHTLPDYIKHGVASTKNCRSGMYGGRVSQVSGLVQTAQECTGYSCQANGAKLFQENSRFVCE